MKDFWNNRYAETAYAYGVLPNEFFKSVLDKLSPGSILLPAEGEGRNAVYASSKGWQVRAFDFSELAKEKAMQLLETQHLTIAYDVLSVLDFKSDEQFEVIGLIYAHFPSDIRKKGHAHLLQYLKPNGIVIFEAFSKAQLGKDSGGPKNLDMLFSLEEVKQEFKGLEFEVLEETNPILSEGLYHIGESSVIRFVGQKI